MSRQLTLSLQPSPRCTFSSFVPGRNEELVERCRGLPEGFSITCIHGEPGSGRSHLLQATCHHHAGLDRRVAYLPLAVAPADAEMLSGLERYGVVALDDLESWLGFVPLERGLIGLYQALQQRNAALLFTSDRSPSELECAFDDLSSRLRGGQAFALEELEDHDKARVLRQRAAERGMLIDAAVMSYWMRRARRGFTGLLADLDRLDEASLSEQRRVTVPLVKQVLGL
ncbi:MAG: DnaA regulatory inactivator Hda [Pseudomonadales bacterium]|jgi:DnaA family protein|nr:DnaA regulatory inactivator Hda [Pseudomonadales bacterium]MDP6472031.1 DnaA regulatory inactivator Hda [Pseudomonadales bacterium]MDP6826696.1 DnaA regulatory inactivator Hda [Pseudomonadales bacterium]MDP6969943.1 DnaA regulatory inactivator Hda [Pseudomonadales bacterium]|tara:strand:+ start:3280 stop:3963 length:684 start_codon:yes stop_codon:yes gene_type:complete